MFYDSDVSYLGRRLEQLEQPLGNLQGSRQEEVGNLEALV